MQTDGFVVLADSWFKGWTAHLDGKPVPVHRANYALRAVAAPAGRHELVYRYDPASFRIGFWAMAAGLIAGLGWAGLSCRRRTRTTVGT